MAIFYLDSGSFGNVTVTNLTATTSSILYVTSSQLNVSTDRITVNTSTPAVRFGGLSVIDSGSSPQRSGSILFDSTNNQWIFVHQSTGGTVTSSVFIQGPQTIDSVGSETTLTTNKIPKAVGGDLGEHIGDSNIRDDGTTIQLGSATQVTGSLLVSSSMTIGSSSLGPSENTLTLGARDTVSEGGQLGFSAPGGSYISASFIDLYQDRLRVLKGTNASSTAEVASWNMQSLQMSLPAYTSATSFGGTMVASLGVDTGGNILTTATSLNHQIAAQQAAGSVIKGYNIGCPIPALAFNSILISSGVTSYTAIYIHTTTTITGVKWYQQNQGNYTANNYNGVGLYSTSGGTLTLVASSSNDGNIWKASGTAFASKAFAATYTANPGIYYIGALYSNSAQVTQPTVGFAGSAAAGSSNLGVLDFTNNNKMNGTAGSSLTTLATSVAASGIAIVQYRYGFYLY